MSVRLDDKSKDEFVGELIPLLRKHKISIDIGNDDEEWCFYGPPNETGHSWVVDGYDIHRGVLECLEVAETAPVAKQIEVETLNEIRSVWAEYTAYLERKYPVTNGEFELTCPHHRRIDALLNPESEAVISCEEKG